MKGIARFEKVSFEQFRIDWRDAFGEKNFTTDEILGIYNNIKLPKRATKYSAGYDFFVPIDIILGENGIIKIPTGIKCRIDEGWTLKMYPRSGQGFRYGVHLANTVGIIDGDYYNSVGNEGHIFVKLVNDSMLSNEIVLKDGVAFCQGIFVPFGVTEDDITSEERAGGLGSTDSR